MRRPPKKSIAGRNTTHAHWDARRGGALAKAGRRRLWSSAPPLLSPRAGDEWSFPVIAVGCVPVGLGSYELGNGYRLGLICLRVDGIQVSLTIERQGQTTARWSSDRDPRECKYQRSGLDHARLEELDEEAMANRAESQVIHTFLPGLELESELNIV